MKAATMLFEDSKAAFSNDAQCNFVNYIELRSNRFSVENV